MSHIPGAKIHSDTPLTPVQEKMRYELWQKWAAKGKVSPAKWHLASCIVRSMTSPNRLKGKEWAKRMLGFRILKYERIAMTRRGVDWFDPATGKMKFAWGLYDPKVAARKGGEVMKKRWEQRRREQAGEKLKHFIPNSGG